MLFKDASKVSVINKLMCMKRTGMCRSENPVTLLLCSLQIPHVLAWGALGAMTKNNMKCGTGGSQSGDYED